MSTIESGVFVYVRIELNFHARFRMLPHNPLKSVSIYIVSCNILSVLSEKLAVEGDSFDVITPNTVRELPFFSNDLKQTRKSLLVFTFSLGVYGYNFTNSSFRYHAVVAADSYEIAYS